jgi:hypothetical protein
MTVSLSRVTGAGDGRGSTSMSPGSTYPRGTAGCYCTRLLRLLSILIRSSTTCLRRVVVVVEFARDPGPGCMGTLISALTGRSMCYRLPVNGRMNGANHHDTRIRCALDMHVLEPESVIGQLGVPIRSVRLPLLLRRAVILRCDAPASRYIPAYQGGRGESSMRLSTVHASIGCGVHPSAVLPLLWIHSWGNGWNKGLVDSLVGNWDCAGGGGIGDDGGRGPG